MHSTVVIYESKYGFTKRYAQWLAKALACPVFEKKRFQSQDFALYDTIIYGGGLYAGGVSGIKLLTENYHALAEKHVILFTCGLADPNVPENVEHIRQALSTVLSADMLEKIEIFHLRGGINYTKLSFLHKAMMAMLRKMLLKKDLTALSSEDKELLETYGKFVDFTDEKSIGEIVEYARAL